MWKALMRRQLWTVDSHGVRGLVRSLRLGEEVKGENGAGKEPVVEVAKSVEKDLVESVSEKVEDLAESVSEGVAEGGFTGGLKALTEETRDLVQEELKAVAEDLVKQAEENVKTAGENIEAVGTLVKAVGEEFSSVGKKIQAFEEKVAEATEEVETIMGEDTPPELTATDNIEDWKRAERQVEKALSRRNDSIAPKRQPKPPSGQFMGQWVLVENLNTYASRDDLRELFKSSRLAPSDCIQKGNPLESLVTQWYVNNMKEKSDKEGLVGLIGQVELVSNRVCPWMIIWTMLFVLTFWSLFSPFVLLTAEHIYACVSLPLSETGSCDSPTPRKRTLRWRKPAIKRSARGK